MTQIILLCEYNLFFMHKKAECSFNYVFMMIQNFYHLQWVGVKRFMAITKH